MTPADGGTEVEVLARLGPGVVTPGWVLGCPQARSFGWWVPGCARQAGAWSAAAKGGRGKGEMMTRAAEIDAGRMSSPVVAAAAAEPPGGADLVATPAGWIAG
ncbi:MAG: hypothetical protein ACRCSN_12640 [Dermatophilaceae bacterium]